MLVDRIAQMKMETARQAGCSWRWKSTARRGVALLVAGLLGLAVSQVVFPVPAVADSYSCRAVNSFSCLTQFGYDGKPMKWGHYPVDAYGNNCTNYAAFRLYRNGATDPGNLGDANHWDNNLPARMVNTTPAVGAIAQWEAQHVAYVEAVASDGSWIRVSESSYGPLNGYPSSSSIRVIYRNGDWPDHFLHIHDQGPAPAIISRTAIRSQYRTDFNGDGKSDVLAASGGQWLVAYSATGGWRHANTSSMDPPECSLASSAERRLRSPVSRHARSLSRTLKWPEN